MRIRPCCVHAMANNDCGPAALATVCRAYGTRISLDHIRSIAGTDMQGTSITALREAAESLGFSASVGRAIAPVGQLPKPAILHLHGDQAGHFIVLFSERRGKLLVADPNVGLLWMRQEDLAMSWSGGVVLLSPKPEFPQWQRDIPRVRPNIVAMMLQPERRAITACCILSMLVWLSAIGLSKITELAVNCLNQPAAWSSLRVIAIAGIAVVAGTSLFIISRGVLLSLLSFRIETAAGMRFTNHILSLPTRTFDHLSAGDMTARLFDIDSLGRVIASVAFTIIVDTAALIITGVILLILNPALAAVTLAGAMAIMLSGLFGARIFEQREREFRMLISRMTTSFMDLLLNIKVVKMYSFADASEKYFTSLYKKMKYSIRGQSLCHSSLAGVGSLASGGVTLAIAVIGVHLILQRHGSLGQLVFYLTIAGLFIGVANQLVPSILSIRQAKIASERLNDLFSRELERQPINHINDIDIAHFDSFSAVNICHAYRKYNTILNDINFTINAGETICILGETGSGKTTLASILAGLYQPDSGEIRINGAPLDPSRHLLLRGNILVIFQEHGLLQGTIRENILLGWPAKDAEIVKAAELACASQFIEQLPGKYDYLTGPGGNLLSSGQRQRITLARALLRNPPILILDEATSNLDCETELKILDNLRRARQSLTTVFITHRLTTAMRADRIIVLERGRIAQQGTHRDLSLQSGAYHRLWRAFGVQAGNMEPAKSLAI